MIKREHYIKEVREFYDLDGSSDNANKKDEKQKKEAKEDKTK